MVKTEPNIWLKRLTVTVCLVGIALATNGQTNRVVSPAPAGPPPVIRLSPAAAPGVLDPLTIVQQSGLDLNATASAEFDPPTVSLGSKVTYHLVVTAMTESVTVPDKLPVPNGLELVKTVQNQTFVPLGTKVQPRTMINYRVNATEPGTYIMPVFTVSANGKPVTVPSCQLTVVASNAAPVLREPHLQIEPVQGEFYVGQSIPVRVVLVDPGDNSVQSMVNAQVSGDACVVDQTLQQHRRELRVVEGRQVIAFSTEVFVSPIKEGPLTLMAQAQAFLNRQPASPTIRLPSYNPLLDAGPVVWTIKRLPREGELPGFTGAIGTFLLEPPVLSTNVVRAGDPLTMTVTIKGQGNLTRLVPPRQSPLKDWQTFPPLADQSPSPVIQQRGSAQFIYTLIPMTDRVSATPSIPFCYFDPVRKAYVDLTIPPVRLKVTPPPASLAAPGKPAETMASRVDDEDQSPREKELVMTGLAELPGSRVSTLRPLQQRPWFLALQLVPAIVLASLWSWDRRRRHLAQNPAILLQRKARRGLRRQYRLASKAVAAQDVRGFVTAAINALREGCAPTEAANPEALVCADVVRGLLPPERAGREAEVVQTLFAAGDALRFATKSPTNGEVLRLWPETENLLTRIKRRL